MRTIPIHASRSYEVIIGPGLLDEAGERISRLFGSCRAMVVADDRVDALYGEALRASLRTGGIEAERFTFPHGEENKNLDTYSTLLEAMCSAKLTRKDLLIALGGGVAGDLGGFAAATYRRGIPYVQLPTTLLAAVDSSVGGKTAVDLAGGKNQVGAFYQPSLVLCDTETLGTLPREERRAGCAEVVKYGLLGSEALFEALEADPAAAWSEDTIAACVEMKRRYVEEDEFDTGSRQFLNLGHTFGHAAELLSGYSLLHGEAVAMGMAAITRSAAEAGICRRETPGRLTALLEACGLPTSLPYPAEDLAQAAGTDKKALGKRITLVVPEAVGRCRLETVPASDLLLWLRRGGAK